MVLNYPVYEEVDIRAAQAATRFGYGLEPGDLPRIRTDPMRWLLAQLEQTPLPKPLAGFSNGPTLMRKQMEAEHAGTLRRYRQEALQTAMYEAGQHALVTLTSPAPYRERLVRFWKNFFNITAVHNPRMVPLVYAFERDVIRPNLTASFYEMLMAAVQHPAVQLLFEDTTYVETPSRNQRNDADLSLARTILGRYTLGPEGDFTDKDVEALADILSGWSIGHLDTKNPGGFVYRADWHRGRDRWLLGRIFPESGMLTGEAAIEHLTHKPQTAWNIAAQMVRYFITDDPAPALIGILVNAYANSGGSLYAMSRELATHSAMWWGEHRKFKTPEDLVFSTHKALQHRPASGQPLVNALEMLGQPQLRPPDPGGWPQAESYWSSPALLNDRLGWLMAQAPFDGTGLPPHQQAFGALGPLVSERSARFIYTAPDPVAGRALLLSSPEFQQR